MKGGGVKGLALAGALLELGKHFSFDTFAGTSAGGIAAVLLGAGYKPSELLKLLRTKDFSDFKDASFLGAIWNFVKTRALYPGNEINNWIGKLLNAKFINMLREVQLSDFESHTIVYSTRANDGTLVFDSKNERKETHASFAARCSMTIPFFFSPETVDGIKVYDGGLRNNFPIKIFTESYPNKPVIGLFLVSGSKKDGSTIGDLRNIIIDGEEATIVEENLDKIVVIDPRPIRTKDFDLSETKKHYLICCGILGALKFILQNYPDIEIKKSRIPYLENRIEKLKNM